MYTPTRESHVLGAQNLYRQRQNLLTQADVDMTGLMDLEQRLRVHIHTLSLCLHDDASEPGKAADTFVYLATRFESTDNELQTQAAARACAWLAEESPRAQGALDALILYPIPAVYAAMKHAFTRQSTLRPTLIYILAQHGAAIPKTLINQADMQQIPQELQIHILRYAAAWPEEDTAIFKRIYQPLLMHSRENMPVFDVMLPALWGGIVRGDGEAITALRRAIEQSADDYERAQLLRLAALSGEHALFPILQQVIEHAPALGYYLMALTGNRAAIETVLAGLQQPRTAQAAAQAWHVISGQTLPVKPRLSVVGQKHTADVTNEHDNEMPDANMAQQWWSKQQKQHEGARLFMGVPVNGTNLHELLKKHAGLISVDLTDLLSIYLKRPLPIGSQLWQHTRLQKLTGIPLTPQTPNHKRPTLARAEVSHA